MSYPITVNLIPNLPKNPYRNGVGKYEGVVAHSTATPNATASAERTYESTHFNDAFVHYFVDWTSIVQVASTDYLAWHAGHTANARYVGVELCETADATKFNESYARYVWLLAKILIDKGLPMVHMQTFFTHDDTSKLFKETNHTDPIAYLSSHGKSVAQLVADVTAQYNAMKAPQPAPVPSNLYRVRTSWADAKSQIGAFANLDSAKALADQHQGYNVYDESGKQVYPIPQPTPAPTTVIYRVRKDWADTKSQIGAYSNLEGAKTVADQNAGYKVFDPSGNQVYPPVVAQPVQTPTPQPTPQPEAKPEELNGALPSGAVGECVIKVADVDIYNNYDEATSQKIGVVIQGQKFPVYKIVNEHYLISNGMWISNIGGANADYQPVVAPVVEPTPVPVADAPVEAPVQEPQPVEPTPVTPPVADTTQPTAPVTPTEPTPVPVIDHTGHHDIMGDSVVAFDKMVAFVQSVNPNAQDITEIALNFIEVGREYGMRGDIAFCQSVLETGYFKYNGGTAVTPDQHNYAGLGVTSKGMKGNSYSSVLDGVKAQMQHLFAYASTDPIPNNDAIIDARFKYVTRGIAPHWEDLNNHWAMNSQYGQEILAIYDKMVAFIPPVVTPVKPVPVVEQPTTPDTPVPSSHINEADVKVAENVIDYIFVKIKNLFK